MPLITADQIKDISVKSVEMFLNDKIPLSEGLAKQASAMELNSEQIKRAVEATNSIAYLKVVSMGGDRTMEFPLCKYAEVMRGVALPDMDKQASVTLRKGSAMGKTEMVPARILEKVAAFEQGHDVELNYSEKFVYFTKMAAINESELEQLQNRSLTIVPELTKAASVIKADPQGLEKLASVCEGKEFAVLSTLVYGQPQTYADTGLFKEADLKQVERVASLYKEAQELVFNIKEKQALSERSALMKQAMFGAIGGALGKTVGSVLSAPFKLLGTGIKRSTENAASTAKNFGTRMGNSTTEQMNKARAQFNMKPKPLKKVPAITKKIGIGAVASTVGVGALDAAVYQPGTDKTTGASKDVWTSLQRQ